MEESSNSTEEAAVIETLKSRGWYLGDIDQLKALIMIHSALADDRDTCTVADSLESELLNMDLRSIGAKSLPDPNLLLRKSSSPLLGPIVLQICSVRDISVSSIERFSKNSSNQRLLRLSLTDGHTEITAIEYSHVPAIPDDVVPGTKVRLENKVVIRSGILCLNPKVITVLGGVVQSLYEEWQMNQKYSGFSRSSLRLKQESDTGGGPPQFEKLQVGAPSQRFAKQGRSLNYSESTSRYSGPIVVGTIGNRQIKREETVDLKAHSVVNDSKTASLAERTEEKPSSSAMRPREVAEAVPVQNQAASQKLLQKMSHPNRDDKHSRGRKHRGKGKQEEQQVFTLDEWEKQKAGAKPRMKNELPDTSRDENLAWQLQNQLDLEDSPVHRGTRDRNAENIRKSMFSYERDDRGMEHRGRGRGKGKGKGRGRGRGRERYD